MSQTVSCYKLLAITGISSHMQTCSNMTVTSILCQTDDTVRQRFLNNNHNYLITTHPLTHLTT